MTLEVAAYVTRVLVAFVFALSSMGSAYIGRMDTAIYTLLWAYILWPKEQPE